MKEVEFMEQSVICTIVAKNYLAHARCLTDSFLEHHPDGRVFVLVIDEFEGYFDPAQERFTTVGIDEIGIKNLVSMIYRYTVLELSTAVKPFFLEYLFDRFDYDRICYFDPDIYFYRPIDEIWDLLDQYRIVLIPHLLDFLDDEFWPNELDILRSGTYNLGFIGLSRNPELSRFLHWWQGKMVRHCVASVDQGLFVDQKWIDLAPSLFSKVYVHRDPGCDVAYWNLNHRHLTSQDGAFVVNGEVPLKFFHFSGFSPDRMDVLSKHQDRFTFQDLPGVRPLFERYRDCLLAHGYETAKQWPYTYNYHAPLGVRVPDIARSLWETWESSNPSWDSLDDVSRENFITEFLTWLNEPVGDEGPGRSIVTRLALAIYQQRSDLQQVYPDVLGRHRVQYINWFLSRAKVELDLDDFFVEPVREGQMRGGRWLVEWFRDFVAQFYMSLANWLFRIGVGQWLEERLGERRIGPVRRFFVRTDPQTIPRPTPPVAKSQVQSAPAGLNVVGYLRDETGVGEVARASMKALQEQGYPIAYTMVSSHAARKNDDSVLHMPRGHPYRFNWLHVNADQVKVAYDELGPEFFEGKYNIAYWAWELDPFPDEWLDRFWYFDEIWVGSSFVQKILASVSPIPIMVIGAPVVERPDPDVTRGRLGLPEDRFLFLFAFDMLSYIERKNPFGTIEAYRRAFGSESKETQLVIKVTNSNYFPEEREALGKAVESVSGILIDGYLDRDELTGLFHVADAYVSLHRSEGFGMTIAEAMCIGKPVIATAYSSTQDYLTVTNGYPVGYRLKRLEEDHGPYKEGGVWADPDLDHAASQIRRVYENPEEALCVGRRASADMERMYSGEAVAGRIIDRLDVISTWLK